MAGNLQKRGSYTPRRAREQRAYRLAVAGSVSGIVGVVGLVLAVAGAVSAALPIIALLLAALCAFGFMATVGSR
jgi:predicted RND superfamily exporter protein